MQYSKLLAMEIDELDTLQDVHQSTIQQAMSKIHQKSRFAYKFHRSVGCLRVVYDFHIKNEFRATFSGWLQ